MTGAIDLYPHYYPSQPCLNQFVTVDELSERLVWKTYTYVVYIITLLEAAKIINVAITEIHKLS